MNVHRLTSRLLVAIIAFAGFAQAQPEVRDEAARAFKRADAELNKTYERLLATIDTQPDHPKQLRADLQKAQRSWIAFRDAEATFRAGLSSGRGSAYTMDYFATLAELTEQRTHDLKRRFKLL
jgi:uncharacterized protein YecT (DUF1311 family)